MVDLELLRTEPKTVKDSVKKRGGDPAVIDRFLELDEKWRSILTQVEQLRQERNKFTQTKESAQQNADNLKEIKAKLLLLEGEVATLAIQRQEAYLVIPQVIAEDVPVGPGESANKVIKTVGQAGKKGLAHEELLTKAGYLDLDTAAKVSGARFRYLKGAAALAEQSLMYQALRFAVKRGFTAVIPPLIVREDLLIKGGFFPSGKDDTFRVEEHFLPGTSEPMLVALAADQTFQADQLPQRLVGFSTCFRREAGSYGKDTKGMFRQHQFDKVEMVSICAPEDSEAEHQFLLKTQEEFIAQFHLPYQVVLIGSGDLEVKATKRFDIETWFPGQERYRETHSVSNCGSYQARRFGIKVRDGDQERYAHTLNGTLATERLLLAIVENGQSEDGHVVLPDSLG